MHPSFIGGGGRPRRTNATSTEAQAIESDWSPPPRYQNFLHDILKTGDMRKREGATKTLVGQNEQSSLMKKQRSQSNKPRCV
jgi:hypothetical protein